jgi:glycerophosphoryl diester phosphodiesterase
MWERDDMEIVAHRGASADAPENTLAAVRLAWEQKADAVEVDVHQTADGHLVVIHDETTDRMTAGRDCFVIRESRWLDLATLDVGSATDSRWAGESIPALKSVLCEVPDGKRLYVELKCGVEAVPEYVRCVRKSGLGIEQLVTIAFDRDVATAVKRELPRYGALWLVDLDSDEVRSAGPFQPADWVSLTRDHGLDGLDFGASEQLDAAHVLALHQAGMRVAVWTVDDVEAARRLEAIGVDALTTNRPGWMREQLEG